MAKKSQCEIHSEEIKELRKAKHNTDTKVQILETYHESNKESIEAVKDSVDNISTEQVTQGKNLAVTMDKVKRIDKTQVAVLGSTFATLVGIVINTYLTLK